MKKCPMSCTLKMSGKRLSRLPRKMDLDQKTSMAGWSKQTFGSLRATISCEASFENRRSRNLCAVRATKFVHVMKLQKAAAGPNPDTKLKSRILEEETIDLDLRDSRAQSCSGRREGRRRTSETLVTRTEFLYIFYMTADQQQNEQMSN